MDKILTIAIPTFNRWNQLTNTLHSLFELGFYSDCNIVVVDNSSENDFAESLPEYLYRPECISFYRNSVNRGLSANIIKCFDLSRTEWIWILSDDDKVLLDSTAVLNSLKDCDYINFSSHLFARSESYRGFGLNEFVNSLDSYSNVLFLSTSIYRHSKFYPFISIAFDGARSINPHIWMLLKGLKENSCFYLSKRILIGNNRESLPSWSIVKQSISFSDILYMDDILDEDLSKTLFDKMTKITVPPIKLLISVLLYTKEKGYSIGVTRRLLRKAFAERYSFASLRVKMLNKLIILSYSLCPRTIEWLFHVISKKGYFKNLRG